MAAKTKKIRQAGKFGAGYGKVKEKYVEVESKQRKKQICPFCHGSSKRQAKGIWLCIKCGKKFTAGAYYI